MAVAGLVILALTMVLLLAAFFFGGVTGEEFNPETFQRRRFQFYEIPLLRVQIWPLSRSDASGELEKLARAQGYVATKLPTDAQWHLFSFRRGAAASPPFDAQILQRYLDAIDDSRNQYWHLWSTAHPQRAKLFWPHVSRFARLRLYVVLPHLFEIARTAEDDASFTTALEAEVVKWLHYYASRRSERGDVAAARSLVEEGLSLAPNHAELQALAASLAEPAAEPAVEPAAKTAPQP
jgi:hypothetical protein